MNTPTEFIPGVAVKIVKLQSRAELNGKVGDIINILDNGRAKVKCRETSELISVRMDNLVLLAKDPQAADNLNSVDIPFILSNNLRIWQSFWYFYAFGNTPAKLLTRHTPLVLLTCNILLLGCGDPRHVFFTAWSHHYSQSHKHITLDVTMCDIEPSILARNIVLFKLILGNSVATEHIWSIFYSQKIDEVCLDILQRCANDLLETAGEEVSTWNSSTFGSLIQFCDSYTYRLVRPIWRLYAKGRLSKSDEAMKMKYRKTKITGPIKDLAIGDTLLHFAPCVFARTDFEKHMEIAKSYRDDGCVHPCVYASATPSKSISPVNSILSISYMS